MWARNRDDDWTRHLKSGMKGGGHAGETETGEKILENWSSNVLELLLRYGALQPV